MSPKVTNLKKINKWHDLLEYVKLSLRVMSYIEITHSDFNQ